MQRGAGSSFASLAAAGSLALAFGWSAPPALAHRPPRAAELWTGLDRPSTAVPADGVRVLRAAPSGRVRIPGGMFVMGSTATEMTHAIELCLREVHAPFCHEELILRFVRAEGVAHAVTLRPFDIDRTEVTVSDYGRCVSAGACAPPAFDGADDRFARPDFPVTHVTWDDAVAYCRFRDGRLPTEAEWEYAARGPDAREFPWGNVYNPHLANHGSLSDDATDGSDGYVGLAPVGSFPDGATPLGVLDMAGNVAEWVADVLEFDGAGQPLPYPPGSVVNPAPRTSGGAFHVVRGGSYATGALYLRSAARDMTSSPRPAAVGFRCVGDVR